MFTTVIFAFTLYVYDAVALCSSTCGRHNDFACRPNSEDAAAGGFCCNP